MSHLLLLVFGALAVSALAGAIKDSSRVQQTLGKVSSRTKMPKAFGVLMLAVQASEITRILDHATLPHIIAAILLLAMWAALRPGAEHEHLP